MADTPFYRFKLRRGTATEWTVKNPVLLEGEPGLETDTKKLKAGDGVTAWNSLEYYYSDEKIIELIQAELELNPIGQEDISQIVDLVEQGLELPDLVLYYENTKA